MILITRPKEQAKDLEMLISSKGYETLRESLYSFKYYKKKIFFDKDKYYIFPSIHSVQSLIKSKQIYKFKNANIFAIGKKVKQILVKSGCKKILLTSIDSNSLLKTLNTLRYSEEKFTYFGSNITNEDFFLKAKKYKINIQKIIIYKTLPVKIFTKRLINNFKLNTVLGITFYSMLAADTFISLSSKYKILSDVKNVHIYCISKRVAKPFQQNNFKYIYVAQQPNQMDLLATIEKNHH